MSSRRRILRRRMISARMMGAYGRGTRSLLWEWLAMRLVDGPFGVSAGAYRSQLDQ